MKKHVKAPSSPQELPVDLEKNAVANDIYERALPQRASWTARVFRAAWTTAGLLALSWFGFMEPFSGRLFAGWVEAGLDPAWVRFVFMPLVMALRGAIVVESWGYVVHRFIQHLGFMTRQGQWVRWGQRFHWIHHMIFYPIGSEFIKDEEYHDSTDDGINWSWTLPFLLAFALIFLIHGVGINSLSFIAGAMAYGKLIQTVHERFHMTHHPFAGHPYFVWLEDIHILHHWDQGTNYGMVNPIMDILFGTFANPKYNADKLADAMRDYELTASDVINWRYLLLEATPVEYAAFVSAAREYPRSLRKVRKLMELLVHRFKTKPDDMEAPHVFRMALDCMQEVASPTSRAIYKDFVRHTPAAPAPVQFKRARVQ